MRVCVRAWVCVCVCMCSKFNLIVVFKVITRGQHETWSNILMELDFSTLYQTHFRFCIEHPSNQMKMILHLCDKVLYTF